VFAPCAIRFGAGLPSVKAGEGERPDSTDGDLERAQVDEAASAGDVTSRGSPEERCKQWANLSLLALEADGAGRRLAESTWRLERLA
jgi:muconolactone delta-isomerase